MSEHLPDLVARVRLDESDLNRTARTRGKVFGASLSKSIGGGFRASIGGSLKGAFAAGAAALGVAALGHTLKGFIDDARESAKVASVTEARIKTTGAAAGLSAEQVGDLATSISEKTGADDEAIQSGENLLLTFTNVRNEVGKGNDIFNQATQAAADLAASMNDGAVTAEGLKGANIQLGKALNDPVKGITALTRVGVSFDEQQKKRIGRFVKEGDVASAQRLILKELGKEFGGTAAAASNAGDRLSVTWGNVKEDLGKILLPAFDTAENALTDLLAGLRGEKGKGKVQWARTAGRDLRNLGATIRDEVIPKIQDLVHWINDELIPALQQDGIGVEFSKTLHQIATDLGDIARLFKTTRGNAEDFGGGLSDAEIVAAILVGTLKAVRFNLHLVAKAIEGVIVVMKFVVAQWLNMVDHFLAGVGLILHGLSHIPGAFGDKFGAAAKSVDNARAKVRSLRADLLSVPTERHTTVTVEIRGGDAAIAKLADIAWRTRQIPREITINTFNRLRNVPVGNAGGGLIRNGMSSWVGEQGRELITATPSGLRVTPHSASEQVARAGNMGELVSAISQLARRPVQLIIDGKMVAQVVDRQIGRAAYLGV